MSQGNELELSWLMPKFSELTHFPNNGEELSAVFVALLLVIFVLFVVVFLFHFIRAWGRISWLKKQLFGLDRATIADKRESLYLAAQERGGPIGHLWVEFDETIVEIRKNDSVTLRNTLDAGHFFNTHTLARGVTENRLIAAVPGFLTAIGVIGTFIGLQLGLSGLQLGGDVPVESMKDGVANVVNGAKVAFLTSVWGVALSVFFNFFEKLCEQRIRRNINSIEWHVDRIFPRIRPEDQLQSISEHTEESRETLQGLAEKIGDRMQEAMVTATQGIQTSLEDSLSKIMAPAINKLVDETSQGNQKALEGLLENFMQGFGHQGEQQRQAMDDVSVKVTQSIESMQTTMNAFVQKLENSQAESGQREKDLIVDISNQVNRLGQQSNEMLKNITSFVGDNMTSLTENLNNREQKSAERDELLTKTITEKINELVRNSREQGQQLSDFVGTQMDKLQTTFNEREQKNTETEKQRNEQIAQQTAAISKLTEDMLTSVEDSLSKQLAASGAILEQGNALQASIDTSVHANAQATSAMRESSAELRVAADKLSLSSSHIHDAGNKLSGAITSAIDSTADLANQNQLSAERMEKLRDELISDVNRFSGLTETLSGMLRTADNTFEQLKLSQKDYLERLKIEVNELSDKMTEMLEDYAKRANSTTEQHLKVWSDSVTQYATQNTRAVQALSNVVDEIEAKVR